MSTIRHTRGPGQHAQNRRSYHLHHDPDRLIPSLARRLRALRRPGSSIQPQVGLIANGTRLSLYALYAAQVWHAARPAMPATDAGAAQRPPSSIAPFQLSDAAVASPDRLCAENLPLPLPGRPTDGGPVGRPDDLLRCRADQTS